jgi:hypothetical protein
VVPYTTRGSQTVETLGHLMAPSVHPLFTPSLKAGGLSRECDNL